MAHSKLEITSTDWHIFSIVPEDTLTANVGAIQRKCSTSCCSLSAEHAVPLACAQDAGAVRPNASNRPSSSSETVIENIPGGFFRYSNDEKQEFDYISEGFLKLLGHTRASFREAYGNRFRQPRPRKTANACSTHQQPDQAQRLRYGGVPRDQGRRAHPVAVR